MANHTSSTDIIGPTTAVLAVSTRKLGWLQSQSEDFKVNITCLNLDHADKYSTLIVLMYLKYFYLAFPFPEGKENALQMHTRKLTIKLKDHKQDSTKYN